MSADLGPLVPSDLAPFVAAGVEQMPVSQLIALVEAVTEAQHELISAALNAALASGRVVEVCPDTPDQLLDPDTITLRLTKENP